MKCPLNHKVVVAVDHSHRMRGSTKNVLDLEQLLSKGKSPSASFVSSSPAAQVAPSFWTTAWEMLIEYSRIIWDIFPNQEKLLRFLVFDKTVQVLNSWREEGQSLEGLIERLLEVGTPLEDTKGKIMNGLRKSVDLLLRLSETQKIAFNSRSSGDLVNRGRIILVTSCLSSEQILELEEELVVYVVEANRRVRDAESDEEDSEVVKGRLKTDVEEGEAMEEDELNLPLESVELVVVNLFPADHKFCVSPVIGPKQIKGGLMSSSVHSIRVDERLPREIYQLAFRHYHLASTTVTGIPMKEETAASASQNYDVELLHEAAAHETVGAKRDDSAHDDEIIRLDYPTLTLRWVLPSKQRSADPDAKDGEFQPCASGHRATTVDVNGRPSVCLTNFILSGRTVHLEYTPPAGSAMGNKTFNSHSLSAHGGDIFIHCLFTNTRSHVPELAPSITEGPGGKISDYRHPELAEALKEFFLLAPWPKHQPLPVTRDSRELSCPLERSKNLASQFTTYYPLTQHYRSSNYLPDQCRTTLYHTLFKDELSDAEIEKCRGVFKELSRLESSPEDLPFPSGTKPKVKAEKLKLMWNEVETLLKAHCRSLSHHKLLDAYYNIRNVEMDVDQAMQEFDRFSAMTEHEKTTFERRPAPSAHQTEGHERKGGVTAPSAAGGPSSKKKGKRVVNVYEWFSSQSSPKADPNKEFVGRLNAVNGVAELYHKAEAELKQLEKTGSSSELIKV